jgi:hypothetical protein
MRSFAGVFMKKHIHSIVSAAIALMALALVSCGGGGKKDPGDDLGIISGGPGVYVAGQNEYSAALWKDGKLITKINHKGASALSVFVSGDDVYMAGYISAGFNNEYAALWKNGVAQKLSDIRGSKAKSVFVSGSDVYVVGVDDCIYRTYPDGGIDTNPLGYATLWKNGVAQRLGDIRGSEANSVFVSDTVVYVAGTDRDDGFHYTYATLWKNGVAQRLSDNKNRLEKAHSVFVSGSDVYVAGINNYYNGYYNGYFLWDRNRATLWKNGVAQKLGDIDNSEANSVFVSGSDVYVAGRDADNTGTFVATLWKNGVAQKLSDAKGSGESVFVSDNDVYVAGWSEEAESGTPYSPKSRATVWKNGVAKTFYTDATSSSYANSVFVVK